MIGTRYAVLLALACVGCGDDESEREIESGAGAGPGSSAQSTSGAGGGGGEAAVCGDGAVDPSEECDGDDVVACQSWYGPSPCVDCKRDESQCKGLCEGATPLALGSVSSSTSPYVAPMINSHCVSTMNGDTVGYTYTAAQAELLMIGLHTEAALYAGVRRSCDDADFVHPFDKEIACASASSGASFTVPLAKDEAVHVIVQGIDVDDGGSFTLETAVVPTTDTEPNDTTETAAPYFAGVIGGIRPDDPADVFSFSLGAGTSTLRAQITDLGTGACDALMLPVRLELVAPDGTTLLAFEEAAHCAPLEVPDLAPGTYYVVVAAEPFHIADVTAFGYGLAIEAE